MYLNYTYKVCLHFVRNSIHYKYRERLYLRNVITVYFFGEKGIKEISMLYVENRCILMLKLVVHIITMVPWGAKDVHIQGVPGGGGEVPDFGRIFLTLKYADITQNTYIRSWTVTEIMAREVWKYDSCYTFIDYQIHIKTGRNM